MGKIEIYEALICLFAIIIVLCLYNLTRRLFKYIIKCIKNEKDKRLYYKKFDKLLADELRKDYSKYRHIDNDRFFTNDDFVSYIVKNSGQNNIN